MKSGREVPGGASRPPTRRWASLAQKCFGGSRTSSGFGKGVSSGNWIGGGSFIGGIGPGSGLGIGGSSGNGGSGSGSGPGIGSPISLSPYDHFLTAERQKMFLFGRARGSSGLSAGRHAVVESHITFFDVPVAGPVNGMLALEKCCELPAIGGGYNRCCNQQQDVPVNRRGV
jgi:hypothetical protein